jgi:hypothetical protein
VTDVAQTGNYRPCPTCHAPIVLPFPADWELEMIKEGPQAGPADTFYMPHLPGCTAPYADPQPGIALRVHGTNVASLSIAVPPPTQLTAVGHVGAGTMVQAVDGAFVKPAVPFDVDGQTWTPVGYTDGGFAFGPEGVADALTIVEAIGLMDPPMPLRTLQARVKGAEKRGEIAHVSTRLPTGRGGRPAREYRASDLFAQHQKWVLGTQGKKPGTL